MLTKLKKQLTSRKKPILWIIVLGFLLYSHTLLFDFIYFDDSHYILELYPFIDKFSNIFKPFFTSVPPAPTYYRPLLTISFIIDAQLSSTRPFFYHLSNLIYHLTSSCLFFLLLTKMKYKKWLALIFSLLFLSHPLFAQTVAWIPARNDSLTTIFFISTIIFFQKYLNTNSIKSYFLQLLFFTLAIFSKELSFILPVILVLYSRLILKHKLSINKLAGLIIGCITAIGTWFIFRQITIASFTNSFLHLSSLSLKELTSAFLLNLGKTIIPLKLSFFPTLNQATLIYGYLTLVLIITTITITKNKRSSYLAFGLFWFLLLSLPSLFFVDRHFIDTQGFMEQRLYLPTIGIFLVFIELTKTIRLTHKSLTIFASLLLTFILLTFQNTSQYKSKTIFWEHATANSPSNPITFKHLGVVYQIDERYKEAEEAYLKALSINPSESDIHNNLGTLYHAQKLYDAAEKEYLQEIDLKPESAETYAHLGVLYYQTDKPDQSVTMLKKALELNQLDVTSRKNLAILYHELGKKSQALEQYYLLEKTGVKLPNLRQKINSLD